eukprot:2223632-Rhodomonas_salina.1
MWLAGEGAVLDHGHIVVHDRDVQDRLAWERGRLCQCSTLAVWCGMPVPDAGSVIWNVSTSHCQQVCGSAGTRR